MLSTFSSDAGIEEETETEMTLQITDYVSSKGNGAGRNEDEDTPVSTER